MHSQRAYEQSEGLSTDREFMHSQRADAQSQGLCTFL